MKDLKTSISFITKDQITSALHFLTRVLLSHILSIETSIELISFKVGCLYGIRKFRIDDVTVTATEDVFFFKFQASKNKMLLKLDKRLKNNGFNTPMKENGCAIIIK